MNIAVPRSLVFLLFKSVSRSFVLVFVLKIVVLVDVYGVSFGFIHSKQKMRSELDGEGSLVQMFGKFTKESSKKRAREESNSDESCDDGDESVETGNKKMKHAIEGNDGFSDDGFLKSPFASSSTQRE